MSELAGCVAVKKKNYAHSLLHKIGNLTVARQQAVDVRSKKLFGNNFDKGSFTRWLKLVNSTCDNKAAAIDSMRKQVIAF